MKLRKAPAATYAFSYRNSPKSGNAINGLGVEEKIRARPVFHSASGRIEWQALDDFFSFISTWGIIKHIMANIWQLRRQNGPVNPVRVAVEDPEEMAAAIKTRAKALGAGLVGITRTLDNAVYAGCEIRYKFAICIGLPMDREEMIHVPQERAAVEVMRAYREVSRIALKLSEEIRAKGWRAKAYSNPNSTDILQIPHAINAGLGQLGKHGSMICEEFGSNFRLAAVVTDLPLATDEPVDIAVDDVCLNCRRCVDDCPPQAIFNEKQMVRGERKWYVDFDKCIPYFVKTYGCAICIEVCPWSEPGRGPWLVQRMMAKRSKDSDSEAPRRKAR